MAQRNSPLDRDKYCCSICLDLLCDPGTLPCGHSYCLACITHYWNNEDVRGVYSCPQCRQTFTPRPALVRNTVLADIMEDLKKTELPDAPPDHCYAGPEDVGCDFCTGRKKKAIKSCLGCLASFCEEHLQSHYEVAGLRRHKLVEPTADLQNNICPRHDEVIKIYCRQDQQTICFLCSIDEHKGHHTVSAETERNERQKELSGHQNAMQERIQTVEEDVKVLQQEMDSISWSADEAVKYTQKTSVEMIRSIEGWRSKVNEKIRTQEKTEVCRALDLQKNLKQEVVEMKRSVAALQHLSQTQSHITFLQKYPQNLRLKKYTGLPTRDIHPMQSLENVIVALTKTTKAQEVFLKDEMPHISQAVAQVDVLLPEQPESKIRGYFLQYSCDLTNDMNTTNSVARHQSLSRSNGKPMRSKQNEQNRSSRNFLSKESLTGRQYWEVKWTTGHVSIGVRYKDSRSSWKDQSLGNDDKSWALFVRPTGITFRHNNIPTTIPGPYPSRVGVYLDFKAGILCFYNISSDRMTLLHKVATTFTQPLYVEMRAIEQPGGTVEFCYPLQV